MKESSNTTNRNAAVISLSAVLISTSNFGEVALSASSQSFSRQRKRASGGIPLGSDPNALCLTYSVVAVCSKINGDNFCFNTFRVKLIKTRR